MSLLRDLWDNSGGDSGGVAELGKNRGLIEEGKKTFPQVVSSSSLGEAPSTRSAARRVSPRMSSKIRLDDARLTGAKRPRSPGEATCGHCFRTSHKTADCRHQIVCLSALVLATWLRVAWWCVAHSANGYM